MFSIPKQIRIYSSQNYESHLMCNSVKSSKLFATDLAMQLNIV